MGYGLRLTELVDLDHPGRHRAARGLPDEGGGRSAAQRQHAEEGEATILRLDAGRADALVPGLGPRADRDADRPRASGRDRRRTWTSAVPPVGRLLRRFPRPRATARASSLSATTTSSLARSAARPSTSGARSTRSGNTPISSSTSRPGGAACSPSTTVGSDGSRSTICALPGAGDEGLGDRSQEQDADRG